ncbi:GntR family transcriptional regulator [Prosthecomicrobium sp. N25]|uniref:GntR family transcriptional regulator n=1 Tax=Prosthecomicrobium sp. N25 TaxID=3129254 RepID=UPI003077CF91
MADRTSSEDDRRPGRTVGFRPLYRQVRDMFEQRIAEGTWAAGQILPSEMQLASELSVSQGTVRKALDEMTADNILVRRQGRGTYVASHDEKRILFQFFKLTPDDGPLRFPDSVVTEAVRRVALPSERDRLGLTGTDEVVAIERTRSLSGEPVLVERIVAPADALPGIEIGEIPNNLYGLYSERYGVVVVRAQEKLKAVAAGPREAAALGVPEGTPLLAIDRLAWSVDGRPIEWRVSMCLTDRHHYLSDLK